MENLFAPSRSFLRKPHKTALNVPGQALILDHGRDFSLLLDFSSLKTILLSDVSCTDINYF